MAASFCQGGTEMLVPQMPTTLLLGSKSLVGLQGTVTNTRDLSVRLCRTEYEGAAVRVGNDPGRARPSAAAATTSGPAVDPAAIAALRRLPSAGATSPREI